MSTKGQIGVEAIRAYLVKHHGAATKAAWSLLDGETVAKILDEAWKGSESKETAKSRPAGKQPDAEWLDSLQADPANQGLDVREQLDKARLWCNQNRRICTRRFFLGWLLRAERVIGPGKTAVNALPEIPGWREFLLLRKAEGRFLQPVPETWESLSIDDRTMVRGFRSSAQSALEFSRSNPEGFRDRCNRSGL